MRCHLSVALLTMALFFFTSSSVRAEMAAARDPSMPILVTVGQKFSLELESNPTTGYEWRLTQPLDATLLHFVGKKYIPTAQASERPLVGGGGKEIWTFDAFSKGMTSISLEYVRLWEKNHQNDKKMIFQVIVK